MPGFIMRIMVLILIKNFERLNRRCKWNRNAVMCSMFLTERPSLVKRWGTLYWVSLLCNPMKKPFRLWKVTKIE